MWLFISAAADRIGIHRTTLKKIADRGEIDYMRVGSGKNKFRKFRIDVIDQYIRDSRFSRLEKHRIDHVVDGDEPLPDDPETPEPPTEGQASIEDYLLSPFESLGRRGSAPEP